MASVFKIQIQILPRIEANALNDHYGSENLMYNICKYSALKYL